MQLTHYKRIALIFSVFFLFMFTLEAMAVEKPRAGSKSSSALTKQKPATQKKKTLTTPQRLGKGNTTIQKKKTISTRKGLSKSRTATQKKKTQPDLGKLRTPDSKKRKFTNQQEGLGKRKAATQKKRALSNQRMLSRKKVDAQKKKAFPPMLTGKTKKRKALSTTKKPSLAIKQRIKKHTIGKEAVSGVSKVVVIPGDGIRPGNSADGLRIPGRVKPEDLANKDMPSGRGKITGVGLGLGKIEYDAPPTIERDTPLEEAEKMRERLNEVQVIGGLDGRNDAQDGGGATTPGAALPEGVGDPTGMVSQKSNVSRKKTTASPGTIVTIETSESGGVVATPEQKAGAKKNKFNQWGALSRFFTGTGNSNKGRALNQAMDEIDSQSGPKTREQWMEEIKDIQNSDSTDKEKETAMTELAAEMEAEKKAAEDAKKAAEDATSDMDPETGGERPETPALDEFAKQNRELQQKAKAGANIDYGDQVEGATNELNEQAVKELPEQVTGQFDAGYQPTGTATEADKQRLLDAADQGTKF